MARREPQNRLPSWGWNISRKMEYKKYKKLGSFAMLINTSRLKKKKKEIKTIIKDYQERMVAYSCFSQLQCLST